jgi:PBP1b-binding outer membrane lipoprotein LpoB
MKNVLFGAIVTLSLFFASCGSTAKTEETKTTEDSTKVEATTVTTPSVDTAKVEK